MRSFKVLMMYSSLISAVACDDDTDGATAVVAPVDSETSALRRHVPQIEPPLDLKTPPSDAAKTASGLIYKKTMIRSDGVQPTPKDMALVNYTGWRQRTGTTFFTTKGRDQPIAIDLAHSAPGFAEALAMLHKGERMMMWVPPGEGAMETLVYEIEVADVVSRVEFARKPSAMRIGPNHAPR